MCPVLRSSELAEQVAGGWSCPDLEFRLTVSKWELKAEWLGGSVIKDHKKCFHLLPLLLLLFFIPV